VAADGLRHVRARHSPAGTSGIGPPPERIPAALEMFAAAPERVLAAPERILAAPE
jgi:hypothetical protein